MAAFTDLFYKILVFLMSAYAMFGGTLDAPSAGQPIANENPAEVCLTGVFWGDTQVSDYMLSRQLYVRNSCLDVAAAEADIDVLITAGDIAENGKGSEYRLVADDFALMNNVDNYLLAVGNHDARLRIYKQTVESFTGFCAQVDPAHPVDGLSFKRDVNGYTFIVLGTDRTEFEESYFTKESLARLDGDLKEATADGKPVFVICHQPLKLTHGLPDTWNSPDYGAGSIGKQSDEIKAILSKYENVFFLTGHLHTGFGEYTYEECDGVHLINVPSLGIKNNDGVKERGLGFVFEIYPGRVVFRARNFASGVWLPEFDNSYAIE